MPSPLSLCVLTSTGLLLTGLFANAAKPVSPWKTTETLSAKIGYDDNLFLQDKNPLTVNPNGEPADATSMVYTASLGLGATWSPSKAFALDASYSPEITRYDSQYSSEDHTDHNFGLGVSGKQSAWSYYAKGSLLAVDGSKTAPIFGQVGGAPPIGAAPVRDRRAQNVIKGSAKLTREFTHGFVRAVGAYYDQNFFTAHRKTTGAGSTPGYANYVDRAEWSVGPEAGWYVKKGLALVAGIRVGEQHQPAYLGNPTQYANTFTRYLVGVEGKPADTLKLAVMAGPDHRNFSPGKGVTIGNKTARYLEASATWTPTNADTFTLAGKDYLWLSSSGRGVYQSSVYDFQWKHTLNAQWSVNSGANIQVGDNRQYNTAATTDQNNWIYTASLGTAYALTAKTQLDLGLTRSWSESELAASKPGREYTRWQASLGVKYTF